MEDRDQAFHGVHVYVMAVWIYVCAGEGNAQAVLWCMAAVCTVGYVYIHAFGGHRLATSWTYSYWWHKTAAASHVSGCLIQQLFTVLGFG